MKENRIKEGWAALGESRATVLYRHMNDKGKNTARLLFKQNVYEKAHSSSSHLTHTRKLLPRGRYCSLPEMEVLKALQN